MEQHIIEARYPITFHEKEGQMLGEHLKNRHNVVMVGMKRVGISNFLRFFLYQPEIVDTYITDGYKHIFIPVDLNDLVEREVGPFWILTLKRLADTIEISRTASDEVKKDMEALFLKSIQTQDTFLTIDNIRKACQMLVQHGYMPTMFFLLFDRMKDAVTPDFFANLQGLRGATQDKLSFVFTSFRSLEVLSPRVFTKGNLVGFSHTMYMQPSSHTDMSIIFETYKKIYGLPLEPEKADLLDLVGGYVRYLHLALIILNEHKKQLPSSGDELSAILLKDERIHLQSEELWESLTVEEQDVLEKVRKKESLSEGDKLRGKYLWDTGMLLPNDGLFSELFADYLEQKKKKAHVDTVPSVDFTKKEHVLFVFLKKHTGEIAEREAIIAAVWPEVEELGVSDWAIDRLVARVRNKLRLQKSKYEIQTIKTRGYKLIEI